MKNPWSKLPSKFPFALEGDKNFIEEHNKSVSEEFRFNLSLLPEPFIGSLNAKIVILALNPGIGDNDEKNSKNKIFINTVLSSLKHENLQYPFYYLDKNLNFHGGYNWWNSRLKELIEFYADEKKLSKNIISFEYYPYHSKKFQEKVPISKLPSFEYTKFLIKKCISEKRTIIIMRGEAQWRKAIPELKNLDYYVCKSSQWVGLSNNNLVLRKKGNIIERILNAKTTN